MSKSEKGRPNGKSNLDDAVVKCPICSDRFTDPKSLPCLHSFCQKCLGTYIYRYTQDNDNPRPNSFPCPQCRAIAIPIDSTAAPSMWAEQLPTNGFIMNVMEIMSFENKEKTCEPCKKQNKESVRADAVVKCPICCDRFTDPKSLPCLHSFCQKCLGTYIDRYTQDNDNPRPNSFPCPQCRAIAIPIDSTAAPSMWAEQLPTNGFIMNVMEIMSFENKEKTCEPCKKQNKESVRADVWCKHCRICLCKTCINYHNALFLDHETMPVDQA